NLHVALTLHEQSVSDAMTKFGRSTGRPILADIDPRRKRLSVDLQGLASEVLDRVADLYDYTWTETGSGTILLVRRFRDPSARPQMNPLELRKAAEDIVGAMRAMPVEGRQIAECFGLVAQSLTPIQRDLLFRNGEVAVGALTQSQQQMV